MNSTRREDDQSFIENEKVSLKIHRDPTTATTMKKRTETRKKENKKSRMAVLMSIGEDHMKWLHPGFRRLLRSPIGINRSLRLRIRARLIRSTLPRCAPFRCSHCQFATNNLPQMTNHICTQRASNHHHQSDNEQRLVDLVHRNRCKDSLAVLERARRPQRFNLPDYSTSIISMDNSFSVPSLRALAYANLSPVNRSHASDAATWTVFQDSKAKFRAYPNSVRKFAKSTLCMSCRQLFLTYQLFDDHLEEPSPCAQTLPEPCVVVLRSDGNVPAEYDHGRRFSTCELTADSQLTCTACNRSQFDSLVHFHTHLIHCANARFIRSSSSLLSSSSSPSSSSSSSSSSSIVSAVEQEDE